MHAGPSYPSQNQQSKPDDYHSDDEGSSDAMDTDDDFVSTADTLNYQDTSSTTPDVEMQPENDEDSASKAAHASAMELIHRIKNMYRLLDLISEQGSGGLGETLAVKKCPSLICGVPSR